MKGSNTKLYVFIGLGLIVTIIVVVLLYKYLKKPQTEPPKPENGTTPD